MHFNQLTTINRLTRCKPPAYFYDRRLRAFKKYLNLKTIWVHNSLVLNMGNALGDVVYDCGRLILQQSVRAESYVHELCHAAVAAHKRPKTWRAVPNFGCVATAEEIHTCHLQFYLIQRWALWDEYSTPRALLDDYSFCMDINYDTTEERDRKVDKRWALLMTKGESLVKKIGLPVKDFERR